MLKKIILTLFLLIVSSSLLGFFLFYYLTLPVATGDTPPQSFTVQSGQGLNTISNNLKSAGLIRNSLIFKIVATNQGVSKKIQAGNFLLSPSMNSNQIAQALTQALATDFSITFLEGWRREEYAQALFTAFQKRNTQFDSQEFLTLTKNQEGFLFPDTYNFAPDTSPDQVVTTLINSFDQQVKIPYTKQIQSHSLNLDQIIILASIIEREARGSARPLVAGILLKRLENNWPLQADATLQYIKGQNQEGDWWIPPLSADKNLNSPYNTYQNPGLPPAPICNPSLDAIQAVLNPTPTEYWFYITDTKGNMHYSETYDQHLDNISRYLN